MTSSRWYSRASRLAIACLLATTATLVLRPTIALAQTTFPTQAMEGNLTVNPGTTLAVGYDFTIPGSHPASTVTFQGTTAVFVAACPGGGAGGSVTVNLSGGPYLDPLNDGSWYPSGDQQSALVFQGTAVVPDLCGGGPVSLAQGGTFATDVSSTDVTHQINVRWHYAAAGSAGGWSGTKSITPSQAGTQPPGPSPSDIVVKVDLQDGYSIGDVIAAFPVSLSSGGLASHGVYLVTPTDPQTQSDPNKLSALAQQIANFGGVVYAEPNVSILLADREFYGWPYGSPVPAGSLPTVFRNQRAVTLLHLGAVHKLEKGDGVIVAVLDTGVDDSVPALAGRVLTGWNYVDDDSDTDDVGTGVDDNGDGIVDSAVGHGTFVSGIVSLVAPHATILPEKVLDSDGYGTIYGAAEAIDDAVASGADVINLSFGTAVQPQSNLLSEAIQRARDAGVVVVAASGNDGNSTQHFPAAQPEVLSVAAVNTSGTDLTPFSDRGGWVDVAAPGQAVVGPMPGGSYATWAGTSMATPFVSGQAALIRAEVPAISVDKVFEAIEQTAVSLPQHPIKSGRIDMSASLSYALSHQ